MKGQHFFYVGLGVLLLTLLVACGQVPLAEPETGQQPAPLETVALQAEASEQHSIEVLPTIDPADRKFFTPGYGVNAGGNDLTAYHQSERDRTPNTELDAVENALAVYYQSEWDRAPNPVLGVEALSKIDPADRKFFSPGYGTQP